MSKLNTLRNNNKKNEASEWTFFFQFLWILSEKNMRPLTHYSFKNSYFFPFTSPTVFSLSQLFAFLKIKQKEKKFLGNYYIIHCFVCFAKNKKRKNAWVNYFLFIFYVKPNVNCFVCQIKYERKRLRFVGKRTKFFFFF